MSDRGQGRGGGRARARAQGLRGQPRGQGQGQGRGGGRGEGRGQARGQGRGQERGGGRGQDRGRGRGRGQDRGRGRGRGQDRSRGRGGAQGGVPPADRESGDPAISPISSTPQGAPVEAAEHIQTVGVRRKGYGTAGTALQVYTNHFNISIPDKIIYHYDALNEGRELTLPVRANMDVIQKLQELVAPEIFTPRCVYDGRKNMYSTRRLPFDDDRETFEVPFGTTTQRPTRVTLTKVAELNPELLQRYVEGRQSLDNDILTTITALNVVVRMEPTARYPFNVRSFFTPYERKDIRNGLELWRGYFQSVRPAVGRMLLNLDISTGMMYKPGPLIDLALDFLEKQGATPDMLAPSRGLPERMRHELQQFLSGVKVTVTAGAGQGRPPRSITSLSRDGPRQLVFTPRDGPATTVAEYFRTTYNVTLRFPDILCAGFGDGGYIPFELCFVPPGQIARKQVPSKKTKAMVEFSTKSPSERLNSIKQGLGVLAHGQSEYVRQFGLHIDETEQLTVPARQLQPPTLQFGEGSKALTVVPRDGTWNMADKKFFRPAQIDKWVVVVFDDQRRFGRNQVREMIRSFLNACRPVGIKVNNEVPNVRYANPQGNIHDVLQAAGDECVSNVEPKGHVPSIFVVVLPEHAADLYRTVKHFGDVTQGVPTQCLKSLKCSRANPQYFTNVCLKVNVKLGGINTVPDPRSASMLTDPQLPTIVMGADVGHPPPSSKERPSFASVVANVDSNASQYVARCRVQQPRQEMIDDLEGMARELIEEYMTNLRENEGKANVEPKRILYFRDGVSEGQFQQVLDDELPCIKKACVSLKIDPAITVIVVGKRHHVRFFPVDARDPRQADRKSGNCKAGTVVDRDIVHPTAVDFYLLPHAGLLGTSRPGRYTLLHDDSSFTNDAIQELCYTLCHVFARSTRSVSVPAPVYYADIVCDRARNHYDPTQGDLNLDASDAASDADAAAARVQRFSDAFMPLHPRMGTKTYFA